MKRQTTILAFAMLCAVIGIALNNADAMAQAPITSNGFRMYNSATDWVTIRPAANGGTGTFLWPLPSAGIFTSDVSGNMTIRTIDDILGDATLTLNNIWVGDATNNPSELAPGTNNQVLQISGGAPTWQTINLLPNGTVADATLAWDNVGGSWVENTNVTMNPTTGNIATTGDVTTGGNTVLGDAAGDAATINAGTVTIPNLGTTATVGGGVLVTDAGGAVEEISINDLIGESTLTLNNIWVGDATNNPAELAPGTNNQVLQISGGAPTWQTLNLLPTGTVADATLVWDNVGGTWVENTNVTMNPTTGNVATSGDLTTNGSTILGDAAGDAATINAGTVTMPNLGTTTTVTGGVLVTDAAGAVEEISVSDLIEESTLSQDALWVGDASNNPVELASSGTQGDLLTVNGSGSPAWVTPVAMVQALGTVAGTGTFTYTVNPGINPTGRVILITLTSTGGPGTGPQVTHAIANVTATTFDVEFPINLGATEEFHWVIY